MRALGLDGFSKGWVAVLVDGDRRILRFHAGIADALSGGFDRAAIDIPIGMTDDGQRRCDLLAREKLRPHSSRVFAGARRWLWEFDDPTEANREAVRRGQKRVSRQLWNIGRKILEVEAFVRGNPFVAVRETHPELVFLRLNGGRPLASKKSEAGRSVRRVLLRQDGFTDIDDWLEGARKGTGAKADDVLDACAAAIAARDLAGCIPEWKAPLDAQGLAMQIWF